MIIPGQKIKNIQRTIARKKIEGFYIGNMTNIRYLTGFTGSSGFVLLTKNNSLFFTDFRYTEQAGSEVSGFEIVIEKGKRIEVLKKFVKKLGLRKLGFETSLSYEFFSLLKKIPVTLMPLKNIVEELRKFKDENELNNIKVAVERAEKAFLKVKPRIKPGIKERELSLRLEELLKREGCKKVPFDIIVASGMNSSMPHARPTEKRIEKGDFVIIDWGGEANGYYSDITRTLLMKGKALSEKIKIYDIVNKARAKAISSVREGMNSRDIDSIARGIIKKAGYEDFFGHGTGHGLGLDVHEGPRISWLGSEKVRNGMVFTIEPGIYLPGTGGVRIEDMVAVTSGKGSALTTLGRGLEIISS